MIGTEHAADWPEPAAAGAARSVLSSDLVVEGNINSNGPVEVQGKVTGQVRAPEVIISQPGTISGSVVALDLSVLGSVSGVISAGQVTLAASADVHADITHGRIAIESGAQVEGKLLRRA